MFSGNVKKPGWRALVALAILVPVLIASAGGCSNGDHSEDENKDQQNMVEEDKKRKEPKKEIEPDPVQPVGVVIDNIERARPQSGLQHATRVYEFMVEGGITRFLAFYDLPFEEDFTIGPVRSLRPYMAHQALEYGGVVAHGGYSDYTAAQISGLDLQHLSSSNLFWRDNSRPSPHNLYTNMKNLRETAGSEEMPREKGTPLDKVEADYKKHGKNEENTDEHVISIEYYHNNQVSYDYDPEAELYRRYINRQPHKDINGEQLNTCRVILRETPHRSIPGTPLVDIELQGEGQGTLYEKGRKYPLTWRKVEGSTKYYFEDGSRLDTSSGTTWIQVIEP